MKITNLIKLSFLTLSILMVQQVSFGQEKPKVFFSDDFLLDNTSAPTYLWFVGDQKGILEKTHPISGKSVEVVRSFAATCEGIIVSEPDDADYVVFLSRYDLLFRPRLAEKKFVVIKVDGEKLVFKASARRASNIVSDSCKAIMKDWKINTPLVNDGLPTLH
jgi:hypothetical protein